MALDFTIIVHVRQQFGTKDLNIGVFAGTEKEFQFDCPNVDTSAHSLLLFQAQSVQKEQTLEVNGSKVFGGVPVGDTAATGFPLGSTVASHTHPVLVPFGGWTGNIMIVNQNVLRESGNVLRKVSHEETFILDNIVILYRTR